MAESVEQFTAPGKYYLELAMEIINAEMNDNRNLYMGLRQHPKGTMFRKNPYYSYLGVEDKNGI